MKSLNFKIENIGLNVVDEQDIYQAEAILENAKILLNKHNYLYSYTFMNSTEIFSVYYNIVEHSNRIKIVYENL